MESATKTLTRIVKRNGSEEAFNPHKITLAMQKAGEAAGEFGHDIAKKLTIRVVNIAHQLTGEKFLRVKKIKDIVEQVLLTPPYLKTARAYILYREQHKQIREIASKFNTNLVNQYLDKEDWRVNENSNMAYSLQGLNHYISSEISKVYWLNQIYPHGVKEAHMQGDLHVHDLGLISVYCVGWDLQDLLVQGFRGAVGKMESAPAKHLRSAFGQIVNFFYTLQGEAAGAQAFSNFDTLLAPFIRYDGMSYKEVKQALQEFIFNVNVPTRVEFQNELDMFNKAFLEVLLEGDAKGRVFTFPIPTYNITKDFDWDNQNIDLLWQITAKYGIPYFSNFINSDMKPEDARSMCCRLRLDNRELRIRGGGLFGASPLTGSIGVVTIDMPRLGYSSKDESDFLKNLAELMEIAKESLETKRKVLEQFTDQDLYPYMKFYLRNVKKRFDQYWKNHFSTIGLLGMNEACRNLFGENIASERGHAFAKEVLDFMRAKLLEFQEESGNNYNLEATPAEGVSYRMAKMDKVRFPQIICANEGES